MGKNKAGKSKMSKDELRKCVSYFEEQGLKWVNFTTDQRMMLYTLQRCGFNVSTAAETMCINRSTHQSWIMSNPFYAEAWQNMREKIVDAAETIVYKKLNDGDYETARYVLRTLGKERGWSETRGTSIEDGNSAGRPLTILESVSEEGQVKLLNNAKKVLSGEATEDDYVAGRRTILSSEGSVEDVEEA